MSVSISPGRTAFTRMPSPATSLARPSVKASIEAQAYRAAAKDGLSPALVFFHGGGWVFGNLDSHDVLCAQLALEAGIAVFHVDYRLAPEARFPAADNDATVKELALAWALNNEAQELDVDDESG